MLRRKAPKKSEQKAIINLTFFILLSIPLVVFGLLQNNFDTRNRAFDDLELSEENPCIISLPHVNPYTLEVGKTVTIQVDAKLTNSGITGLEIQDSSGLLIHQDTFENTPLEIGTSFKYTPAKSGTIDILGIVRKTEGGSVACKISSPYDVKGLRAVANNNSPEFSSRPTDSKPSQDIKSGIIYEYTLTARDNDGDRINYSYSFTPRADWLKPTIIEDGSNGKLTIKFRGSTEKAASYLANVFIHDGYSKHLRSQSWVISVSPKENDIPLVKIIDPTEGIRVNSGEKFRTAWQATDLNHITKYQIYMAKNPTDEKSWVGIDTNVGYNKSSYQVPTNSLSAGTYKLILRAIDNRNPAGVGTAISPEIVISKTGNDTEKPDSDDSVVINDPQVSNMSPSSTDEVTNRKPTIKATITASEGGKIDEETILFKVDDIDQSDKIKINRISESEYTLIYQPKEDLTVGIHKIEVFFKDSNEKEITKAWDFSILGEEPTNSDNIDIFGYQIPKRTLMIIGIGILIVLLALVAPFVIASIWKEDKNRIGEQVYPNEQLPPSIPEENTQYIQQSNNSELRDMVEPKVEEALPETPVEDKWDSFAAPEPTEISDIPTVEPPISEQKQEPAITAIPEPAIQEEVIPVVQPLEANFLPTPPVPQTSITEDIQTPPLPEATVEIPEPEIPNAEELQSIFEQIQKQEAETPSSDTNGTQE